MIIKNKVSIIIPVYRAADTIGRCVESLEKNTFKDFQIILVEDCSGDETIAVCRDLEGHYDNVVCIENDKNYGVSYTRNRGLDCADGTCLMFVDSDDYVEADYIETMLEACEQNKKLIPVCGYVNHDEKKNGRIDVFLPGDQRQSVRQPIEIMEDLYEKRVVQFLSNKIFLMDIVRENQIRFEEELFIGEDFRFLLEYMKAAKTEGFLFVNKPLYHYMRDNENSLMSRLFESKIQDAIDNFKIMYEIMGKNSLEIQRLLEVQRKKQVEYYAYTIMHDDKMSGKEKKERIFQLPSDHTEKLYRQQKLLKGKERVYKWRNRLLNKELI